MTEYNKKNKIGVQLITYPDSLGENLKDLKYILDTYLSSAVTGVHILPFYPSSSDRGFSPLTHRQVEPKFGNDKDVSRISQDYSLMADLIVNHISSQSKYFQDYLRNGDNSKYRKFFIKSRYFARRLYIKPKTKIAKMALYCVGRLATILRNIDFIMHKDGVNKLVLKRIYRPRPGSPFVKFKRRDGKSRYIWCTFSPDQIDLNIKSPAVRRKFKKDIEFLAKLGTSHLRLDAVAYIGKKRGTNSFLIPETIRFIKWLSKIAHQHNMQVIPEIHFDYQVQLSLAKMKEIDYVYDFSLPLLMLNAIYRKNTKHLKNWLKIRPTNSISNLDTHDGIGVIDAKQLLSDEEIEWTSTKIYKKGGNATKRASGKNSNNVDVYQINCTFYSALGEDKQAYLLARAVQLFLPGIPQIYYVGMLAGKNDTELLKKTNNGRDINRHHYTKKEVRKNCNRKVVKDFLNLCELRNTHPAFNGSYELKETDNENIEIAWKKNKSKIKLIANFKDCKYKIVL